jgi:hypothetical protein
MLTKLSGGFDWQAQTYAGFGATYYLAGVRKRSEGWSSIEDAISDQLEAFKYVSEALNLVREHNLETHLVLVLDRMGDIFLEMNEFKAHSESEDTAKSLVRRFQEALDSLTLVEEANWLYGLREPDNPFASLDTLGKAQRLFEVAFLQAEKMQSPHQVLDSLVSAARVAQRRNRKADIEHYTTLIDILSGFDDPMQEAIFLNLLDVFLAHLTFDDDPEGSLDQYEIALANLADFGGFGWLQARKELPEVEKRLVSLDPSFKKDICQRLADAWSNNTELLAFVKGLQDFI